MSLVLRSAAEPAGKDAVAAKDAPAGNDVVADKNGKPGQGDGKEPSDEATHTWESEVSPLMRRPDRGTGGVASVTILRGAGKGRREFRSTGHRRRRPWRWRRTRWRIMAAMAPRGLSTLAMRRCANTAGAGLSWRFLMIKLRAVAAYPDGRDPDSQSSLLLGTCAPGVGPKPRIRPSGDPDFQSMSARAS